MHGVGARKVEIHEICLSGVHDGSLLCLAGWSGPVCIYRACATGFGIGKHRTQVADRNGVDGLTL